MENNNSHSQNSLGYGIYILVWLALVTLTTVTVTVSGMDLRSLTVTVALVIASLKTYLVINIFMHLRSEGKTFKVFVLVALLFLLVSFILLFADYSFH
jgi:cytochrome c oxidase subunit 4